MKFLGLMKLVEKRLGTGVQLQIIGNGQLIGFRINYPSLTGEQQLEKWLHRYEMDTRLGNRERTVINAMCLEILLK